MKNEELKVYLSVDIDQASKDFGITLYDAMKRSMTTFANHWTYGINDCKACKHGRQHHNKDKRMKSGYGKCICGNCKKFSDPYTLTINGNFNMPPGTYKGFYTAYPVRHTATFIISDQELRSSNLTMTEIALNKLPKTNPGINRIVTRYEVSKEVGVTNGIMVRLEYTES